MIAGAVRTFTAKLGGATPRERAGLALLGAIAAVTAAVYAWDWANSSAVEAATATQSAAEAATLETAFADEGYRRLLAAETGRIWHWSRSADAIAGEEVVMELEALCMQAGFNEPRVVLVEQSAARGRVGALEASIAADFDWASFLALLEAFEASELSIAVRSIDVSDGGGAQQMTLVVAVPVINGEEAP
jgi:hypothetical protein